MSPPALFSPVGEFKGWFSNLFNWKPQPPCVLYSPADISATRNETVRLLEQLGVVVALEEGLLRCRLDDSVDGSGGGGQKRAWFKVELVGTGVGSGPLPTPRLLALSPNPNASTSPNSISDVSPNPNFHSHFNNGAGGARSSVLPVAYVPGSACAIVLAQEKGSVATFKSVCRRVKEEWRVGEAGLVAPTPVPALGLGVGMPGGAEHVQRFSA